MGLSLSLLNKLGVPGVSSLTTDHFYDRFFNNDIRQFEDFHIAFIDLCKFLNDVMPGKHFDAPEKKKIKEFYNGTWMSNLETRKEELTAFVQKWVKESDKSETSGKAVIITGMVVPAAAVVLKNTAENIQPVKRFKLHLIPNLVFVPTCTFLALVGVQLMHVSKKSKS